MDAEHHRKKVREFMARPPFLKRELTETELRMFCQALTHDSYSNEAGTGTSYEGPEFLGDAVIELVVRERIFLSEPSSEGNMTVRKNEIVADHKMSQRILEKGIDIDSVMLVGHGHTDAVTKKNVICESMRADSFEALIASVYLLYGLNEAGRVVSAVLFE